ncbi:hypothetical protein ACFLU6_04850 [Acidobacteriota bacterium]
MRIKTYVAFSVLFCVALFFVGCEKDTLMTEMKRVIPVIEGATVLKSYLPNEKMAVMELEVDASKVPQKAILDFYQNTLTKQGWESKGIKDYGKNGSLMELKKKDWGTLSVQTITKKTDKTGKIPFVLSLSLD